MNKIKKKDFLKEICPDNVTVLISKLMLLKKELLICRMQIDFKETSRFSYLKKNAARILTLIQQKSRNSISKIG